MQADFAVELGQDDETLEFPWSAPQHGLRYYDLKRQPGLLIEIEEARRFPELGTFLATVNAPACILQTAKCDAWGSSELNPEEEIFAATCKFGCYVDLLFEDETARYSFPEQETLARRLSELLRHVPEIPAAAEFLIRRCYYHQNSAPVREGFYVTVYVFGYGQDEAEARQRWGIALKLVENAIRQVSLRSRL